MDFDFEIKFNFTVNEHSNKGGLMLYTGSKFHRCYLTHINYLTERNINTDTSYVHTPFKLK